MDQPIDHGARIAELGHVGLRCFDVDRQATFFTGVLGLTVTDRDEDLNICFLSARPAEEHHELLLSGGRVAGPDPSPIQQISFRCDGLADVQEFHRRLVVAGAAMDMIVSHGNAIGVYFFDPEGNRCEIYCRTGLTARQPFVQDIDLDTDADELFNAIRRSIDEFGASGYTEPAYTEWVRQTSASSNSSALSTSSTSTSSTNESTLGEGPHHEQ